MTDKSLDQEATEEDLQGLQDSNSELRKKIAEANSRTASAAQVTERNLQAAQLVTEQVRLEAELEKAESVADAIETGEGSKELMDSIKSQLESATLVAQQPSGPVDTNVKSDDKSLEDEEPDDETNPQSGYNSPGFLK